MIHERKDTRVAWAVLVAVAIQIAVSLFQIGRLTRQVDDLERGLNELRDHTSTQIIGQREALEKWLDDIRQRVERLTIMMIDHMQSYPHAGGRHAGGR